VDALKRLGRFFLLAVDAPLETRYERIVRRSSSTDAVSLEKFRRTTLGDDLRTQPPEYRRCMEMADTD